MPIDFPDYPAYPDFEKIPCFAAEYEDSEGSGWSPAGNVAWEDFYDLPTGSTKKALVPAGPAATLDETEIGLELAIDKIMRFRSEGISSELEMAHIHAPTANNRLELHIDGHRTYPEIIRAIEQARHHVHMTYFKFMNDHAGNQIVDALIEKAQEGISVRFMVDSIGSELYFKDAGHRMLERLEAGGVEIIANPTGFWNATGTRWMSPPDHRKIIVIDGHTAFTGGMNVADTYVVNYHDTMIKIQGHAAQQLQVEWIQSWLNRGGELDPDASELAVRDSYFPVIDDFPGFTQVKVVQGHPGHNDEIRRNYLELIRTAEKTIHLQVPYFSVAEVYEALIDAGRRGVDVHLILPEDNDSKICAAYSRSWYPRLLEAGVRVFEYPGFSHLKGMVVDGYKTIWGSSNLDGLSLYHIRELNIVVENDYFAQMIFHRIFKPDMEEAKQIVQAQNSWMDSIKSGFLHLVSDYF